MTFKELPIGQPFRQANHQPQVEWIKTPLTKTAIRRYNATTKDGKRFAMVGHRTKVLTPPYGDTTQAKRQQERRQRLKALLLSAGWSSQSELDTAYLTGVVVVPRKQMSATEFDTAVNQMAAEE